MVEPFEFLNPFNTWNERLHTQYAEARNAGGAATRYDDPHAVCFCAIGWLRRQGVSEPMIKAFDLWLWQNTQKYTIVSANDDAGFSPDNFKSFWEDFLSERARIPST